MRIFNIDKNQELQYDELDLTKGYLKNDVLVTHIDEQKEVQQKSHYEVIEEYPNGGKDVKEVVDVEYKPYIPEHDEEEEIQVYIEYTEKELEEQLLNNLRRQRELECFSVINRGELWYNRLTEEQVQDLQNWYNAWLDVTETKVVPDKPSWLK